MGDRTDAVLDLFLNMTEEEFLILWKWGGYRGVPPRDVDRRIVAMVKGMTPQARRDVGRAFVRAFAALPPQIRAALAALLLVLVGRPAGIPLPAAAPRALSPQRRWHRLTPARAP
ncbi:hypothetical protein [Streptomyces sp. SCL15-4]|uniref:hypothetical protein n=1 Tax=Streptomyces sp. SCL15-4 TaxID=2967221 RepID=UPI0029663499|nr:hypothetical protein [Streptomyces sp. SCL15-4]